MSPDDIECQLITLINTAAGEENRQKLDELVNQIWALLAEREKAKKNSPLPKNTFSAS